MLEFTASAATMPTPVLMAVPVPVPVAMAAVAVAAVAAVALIASTLAGLLYNASIDPLHDKIAGNVLFYLERKLLSCRGLSRRSVSMPQPVVVQIRMTTRTFQS